MASIACCFIHLEARIEVLIMIRRILKRLKLLNTFERIKCLTPEYITKMRRSREKNPYNNNSRQRSASCATSSYARNSLSRPASSFVLPATHPRSYSQAFIHDVNNVNDEITVAVPSNILHAEHSDSLLGNEKIYLEILFFVFFFLS